MLDTQQVVQQRCRTSNSVPLYLEYITVWPVVTFTLTISSLSSFFFPSPTATTWEAAHVVYREDVDQK